MDIEVVGHETDAMTGRMTIHVQSVERISKNEVHRGPVKTYSIDPDSVDMAHEGDVDKWLEWVKCRHQRFCGVNREMVAKVAGLKGKKL